MGICSRRFRLTGVKFIIEKYVFVYPGKTRAGMCYARIVGGTLDKISVGSVTYHKGNRILELLRPDLLLVPHASSIKKTRPLPNLVVPEGTHFRYVGAGWRSSYSWFPDGFVGKRGELANNAFRMAVYHLILESGVDLPSKLKGRFFELTLSLAEQDGSVWH